MEYYGTAYGFCSQTADIWQLLGYFVMIFKIVLPIVLIILGMFTLGKAVISDDDKDMKKGINSMLKKFVASVVIFFLPTIVTALFGIVDGFDDLKSDYSVCQDCMTHPKGENCVSKVLAAKNDED